MIGSRHQQTPCSIGKKLR